MEPGDRFETLLEHLALDGIVARLKGLEVPSDALTWTRFFGSLMLVLVVLLFLTGAFMAFYYSPAPGAAYDSVDYASFSIPFGEMVRGVHHYAWNLLLIVMGLHLVRAFLVGGYKAPPAAGLGLWSGDHAYRAGLHLHRRPASMGPERLLVNPGAQYHHGLSSPGRRSPDQDASGRPSNRRSHSEPVLRATHHHPAGPAPLFDRSPLPFSQVSGAVRPALRGRRKSAKGTFLTQHGQPLAGSVPRGRCDPGVGRLALAGSFRKPG